MIEQSDQPSRVDMAREAFAAQWRARPLVVALAGAALLAMLVLLLARHALFDPAPAPVPPTPPGAFRPTPAQFAALRIEPVRYGANAELLRATGSILADADHSTPILLPFSGQVLQVFVEPGQRVKAGEPLLRIASPELIDARNTALSSGAQVATATEAVRLATANAQRQKAIYQTAGGALKDYLQAQADLVTAQANLQATLSAARAGRERLGLFGQNTSASGTGPQAVSGVYRAPVAGIVADRSVAPGQFISAGGSSALMTITDPAHVWMVAQLAESDAAAIRLGDHVTVTTPALPGRMFDARIDNIAAALDPSTHRLPVRATVANPDGALKPQMFASFVIRRALAGGAGVLVPAPAVIYEGEGARVWVAASGGLLYGRPVTVADTEGGFTRVTAGLHPGDRVVTSGALFVNEAGLNP